MLTKEASVKLTVVPEVVDGQLKIELNVETRSGDLVKASERGGRLATKLIEKIESTAKKSERRNPLKYVPFDGMRRYQKYVVLTLKEYCAYHQKYEPDFYDDAK